MPLKVNYYVNKSKKVQFSSWLKLRYLSGPNGLDHLRIKLNNLASSVRVYKLWEKSTKSFRAVLANSRSAVVH